MKKQVFFFLIFISCFATVTFPQRGKNGSLTVTSTGTIVNAYTTLTANANAGATSINVVSNTLSSHFSSPLAAGDLLFIIQMQGTKITTDQYWYGYGYIEKYNHCGKYEFAQVASVSGSNTIVLTCGLQNNYKSSGVVQVIRVPRYNTLTINSGAELSCDAWNGTTGGVLVVEALGNVVNNGTVNVTAKGFRGGATSPQFSNPALVKDDYSSSDVNAGGQKGEGIAGYGAGAYQYCMGPPANGGGGGNSHNAGGGGGSNVSSNFAYNGCGFPDITTNTNYITAWNLESAPAMGWIGTPNQFSTNASYGGGRGGYTFSADDEDALTVGPNNPAWSGTNRTNVGGLGGWPLASNLNDTLRLFMGGGGGGGSANDTWGGAGGNGGGITYFMVYGTVSGSGTYTANGYPGGNSEGTQPGFLSSDKTGIDGSGGGGGGGAIVINSIGAISGISIDANGGKGGDQRKKVGGANTTNKEAEGPGGGGAGGYIAVSGGSVARNTNGGINGTSTSTNYYSFIDNDAMEEFPPNGATKGGPGINNATAANFSITAPNVLACQGQAVTLTATLSGTVPAGISYGWYTAEVGGSLLSSGLTLTINNPQANTTYYFGTCPGTYRVPVTMNVSPFLPDAGNNTSLCLGNQVQLQASGGTIYSWSPSTGLSNSTVADPYCTATSTTTYHVTITNGDGCTAIDSVKVTVNSVTPVVSHDTTICSGSPLTLTASGGSGYLWSTGSGASSINVAPTSTQTYLVTVNNLGCSATADIAVTVNPKPVVDLGTDTSFCQGAALILDAGNPGSGFLWQNSSSGQTLSAGTSGLYWVEVTNTYLCKKRDSITITVVPWSDATITPTSPLCINASPLTLDAADNGGVWSGSGITNAATGLFDPAAAGAGNIEIIYAISGMCGDADTTSIQVNALPLVFIGNDTSICNGDTLLLNAGNPGADYAWSNSSSNQTTEVFAQGNYWVQVTDINSCSSSDSVYLTVLPVADAAITPVGPVCSNIAPFDLVAVQSGGIWNGNGITDSIAGSFDPSAAVSGMNEIYYTISGLCGDADTISIKVFPAQTVDMDYTLPGCPDLNNGTITLTVSGGTLPYTFTWNTGDSVNLLTNLPNGTYSVTVSDSNHCVETRSVEFEVIVDCITPVVYVPNIFSPNDDGQNDIFYVRGQDIRSMHLLIFDRWGEKIFETEDITQGWDGKYKGQDMPSDDYVYNLTITYNDGSDLKKKGNISLVR